MDIRRNNEHDTHKRNTTSTEQSTIVNTNNGERSGCFKFFVGNVWRANDIKPNLKRTFKLSKDPHFKKEFWDVIGLYYDPPDNAVVFAVMKRPSVRHLKEHNQVCL